MSISILEMDTEFGYDMLKIKDGAGGDKAPVLAIMSGTMTHDAVISSQQELQVTFESDASINKKGFKAIVVVFKKEGEYI